MDRFARIVDGATTIMAGGAILCLFGAILSISWMVLWRALGFVNSWELESCIYLAVAAVFLASPHTLRTHGHIGMEFLEVVLSKRGRRYLAVGGAFLGLAVCAYLTYAGFALTLRAYLAGERALGVWTPPLWPKYAAMPLGLGMTALQYVVTLHRLLAASAPVPGGHRE